MKLVTIEILYSLLEISKGWSKRTSLSNNRKNNQRLSISNNPWRKFSLVSSLSMLLIWFSLADNRRKSLETYKITSIRFLSIAILKS